jgi:hypothetical protein
VVFLSEKLVLCLHSSQGAEARVWVAVGLASFLFSTSSPAGGCKAECDLSSLRTGNSRKCCHQKHIHHISLDSSHLGCGHLCEHTTSWQPLSAGAHENTGFLYSKTSLCSSCPGRKTHMITCMCIHLCTHMCVHGRTGELDSFWLDGSQDSEKIK